MQQLWLHRVLLCACLYLVVAQGFNGSLDNEFLSLPATSQTPARLVFNQADLANCVGDPSATRCVVRAPIKIDPAAWKAHFAATDGAAVITPQRVNITITSGPPTGGGADDGGNDVVQLPQLQRLDWSGLAGVIALQPGTRLRITNMDMGNFSLKSDYVYTPSTPYQSVGSGVSIWPTINGAPNTTFVGLNITGSYYNPSDTDDCPRYVEKTLLFLIQSFGANNISVVSPTAVLITGPIRITVAVKNGSTGEHAGNATAVYKYVTVVCVERNVTLVPAGGGLSQGALAAAIAVPVTVTLLLGGGLLLWWCSRRRRRSRRALHPIRGDKAAVGAAALGDLEKGGGPLGGGSDLQAPKDAAQASARTSAGTDPRDGSASAAPGGSLLQQQGPEHAWESGGTVLSTCNTQGSGQAAAWSSAPSTGPASIARTSMGTLNELYATGLTNSGLPSSGLGSGLASCMNTPLSIATASGRTGDDRHEHTSALLKARSDAAVIKDLKLGPLLGSGSFGRVYKGRWKATPVAVKIIEHYSSAEGVGSSRGNRISAGREMLFATSISHPNLVTTFHISTLSAAQRKGGGAVASTAEEPDSRRLSNISNSSSNSSSGPLEGGQPDLLETWIVMELCPKGSLEKALKTGKLKKADGAPDMAAIYKVLLDTASGLDYLHSIGVVHGDLKTANVLLKGGKDQRGISCKITDFGLSRVLDMNASHISTGTHGTVVYMPKELLLSGRMTPATDIYSFGLMMWELFMSQRILESEDGLSIGQMFYMIAYQNWRPELPPHCPSGYAELMMACWHDDPEQRPTAQQLLRRLQILQGQARQESVAARKARSAAGRNADGRITESAASESEAAVAAQHLRHLRMLAASSNGAGDEDAASSTRTTSADQIHTAPQPLQQQQVGVVLQPAVAAPPTVRHASPFAGTSTNPAADTRDTAAAPPGVFTAGAAAKGAAPVTSPFQAQATVGAGQQLQLPQLQQQQLVQSRQGSFQGRLPGSSELSEDQMQVMSRALTLHHQQQQQQQDQGQQVWPMGSTAPAVVPTAAGLSVPQQYLQTLGWVQQHTSATAAPAGSIAVLTSSSPYSANPYGAALPAAVLPQAQQQQPHWQAAFNNNQYTHTNPNVGFVSPYGQEFAGCLVDFKSGAEIEPESTMAAYIAALEAASGNQTGVGPG